MELFYNTSGVRTHRYWGCYFEFIAGPYVYVVVRFIIYNDALNQLLVEFKHHLMFCNRRQRSTFQYLAE